MRQISKLLIANRGEIAVRIARACRELQIKPIAVYSTCDKTARHVRMCDEAHYIGESPAAKSYLVAENIIAAAKQSGADAIHPGYGFLSENSIFAKSCLDADLIYVGSTPETIALLGDKLKARQLATSAGLPVAPGIIVDNANLTDAIEFSKKMKFPVLVKAAAGGGGKGMRVVHSVDDLEESIRSASREAKSAFGDGRVFIEKYLSKPRHVEIQILRDTHGNCVYLNERECSIQRRHQKVIEEAPSPIIDAKLRKRIGEAAVELIARAGYINACTCEFLVDEDKNYYFLEVNTRLQVEHPVTEMTTGIDLVKEQIRISEGKPLSFRQTDVAILGHAIELRIYAEDPDEDFAPSTGTLQRYTEPNGPGVRVDSGVIASSEIPIYYDPMMAKLIVWGKDRAEAVARANRALSEYVISGVKTTIAFHQTVLEHPRFIRGDITTHFLKEEFPDNNYRRVNRNTNMCAAIVVAVDKFLKEGQSLYAHSRSDKPGLWTQIHRKNALRNFRGSR